MPQDGLRSALYRSFVTCDDPKGVVECRAFRKSKTKPKRLEEKGESRTNPRNLNSSSAYKEESVEMVSENVTEDLHNPSSFQLMEVSRGARKLNRVMDSCPSGMTFDKEIAKDLLKGALDLQESLIMLGKLQENLRKNQKEKSRGERIDGVGIERTDSHHFQDHNFQMGFQKPGFSADGSSRDCFEELRTAIRDGFASQSLLPPSRTAKEAYHYHDKRTLDSCPDIASTSSSQSFHGFTSSDSSVSSNVPHKSKGSNLIAKLMGLEEIPLEAVQFTLQKNLESEKISIQRRPMFDIDKLKARKPQSAAYKVDTEPRKLKEIVETTQFKGLLKGDSAEGFGLQSHHSDASNFIKRFTVTEDDPPIVIIKPLQFSSAEAEETRLEKFIQRVGALDSRKVLGKLKTKELQPRTTDHCEEGFNTGEMCRRLKGEETPTKRFGQEGGVKNSKEVQAKPEEIIVVKANDKLSSNELKAFVPSNQQQKKKALEKKVDRIQKVALRRKKPAEMENVKSKAFSKSHDQAKVTSTKERKPEIGSSITKSRISHQKSTSGNISKHTTPSISRNRGDRKKNLNKEKSIKEPLAANLVVENVGCKDGDKMIELSCENVSDLTRTTATTADQLLTKRKTDSSDIQIKDRCDSSQNSLCNVIPQTTQHESFAKSAEETNDCISHNTTEEKCLRTQTNAEDLFLSSPSFLSYAEELFNINANQKIVLQKTSSNDFGITDTTRLLVDCAKELVQHKSHRCSQTRHPLLLTPVKISNTSVSLAQLVEEVHNGIENLRSYSKRAGEKLPTDILYAVLDVRCKGVLSGAWDLGWMHAFTVDEVEQVVGDTEKLIFRELIEDLLTDFLF